MKINKKKYPSTESVPESSKAVSGPSAAALSLKCVLIDAKRYNGDLILVSWVSIWKHNGIIWTSTYKVCRDDDHDPAKKLKNSPTLRFSHARYVGGSVVVVVTERKCPTSKLNNPRRLKVLMTLDFSRGRSRALFYLFIQSHANTLCRQRLGNSSWRHGGQRTRHLPQHRYRLPLALSTLTMQGSL